MTREDFMYALQTCGCLFHDGKTWYEENELIQCFEDLELIEKEKPKEPKYCDRNICVSNEYNGIGCDECEVTKSQEPKTRQFAEWVATEIFDDNWKYNKDAFAELACRKLAKLGIVKAKGDEWKLVEPQERRDKICR